MKKILLGTVALIAMGMSVPASAADLAARPYKAAPIAVPIMYDWSGFYIGANGGWGSARSCWGIVPVAGAVIPDGCADRSGGVAGGQIGYRWQSSSWVFGLEAQGDWANLSGQAVSVFNPAFTTRTKIEDLALFTGQVGYAWNSVLLYVKGGAAFTGNRFDVLTTVGGVNVATASSNRWGGTVGVGLEYGFAPNWSAGVEYDHLFMGDSNNSFSVVNPLLAGAANRISQDVDMVTVRVNYRFGGPVVARY
jgi:outer membrane immunogenic protein